MADSRRGDARHSNAATACQLSGAGAEHEGLRGRARGGRDGRSPCSAPRRKPFRRRTSTARSPNRSTASGPSSQRRRRRMCKVRGYVSCVLGCPYQGEVTARGRGRRWRRRCSTWAAMRSRSATPSASARPGRRATMIEAVARRVPLARNLPAISTTPTAWPSPTSTPRWRWAWRCSMLVGRRPRAAVPTRRVPRATSPPRTLSYLLNGLGIETGIDLAALAETGVWIARQLGRETGSKAARALLAKQLSLPARIRVIERGWLSSNNIVCFEGEAATLVDSGYVGHAAQTVELVKSAVAERHLDASDQHPFALRPHRRQRGRAARLRLRDPHPRRHRGAHCQLGRGGAAARPGRAARRPLPPRRRDRTG